MQIKIGDSIIENQTSAKLQGVKLEDSLKWKEHIQGKGGVITFLNTRLFLTRRPKLKKGVEYGVDTHIELNSSTIKERKYISPLKLTSPTRLESEP